MEDKKPELKVVDATGKKSKQPWSIKKILTTVIIAILALLMVGSAYYIVVMVQQSKDTTNVYGYYNGEPVKYEYNSLFYNTLMSDEDYITAVYSSDYNTMYSCMATAYQQQVIFVALSQMAEEAEIVAPESLVNQLVIESGSFAGDDGTFDPEVYKSASLSVKTSAYDYCEKLYPYQVVASDFATVLTSDAETNFVVDLTKNTRDVQVFAIDYNAYPDNLAESYDISEMDLEQDENGANIQPTLSEIKAYIYSVNADEVTPYIEAAVAQAQEYIDVNDFECAAEFGSEITDVYGITSNPGDSQFFSGISALDGSGYLAANESEELYADIFNAQEGDIIGPYTENGAYVYAKVTETESETNFSYITSLYYQYYSSQLTSYDLQGAILYSDKFEDNFYYQFLTSIFSSQS